MLNIYALLEPGRRMLLKYLPVFHALDECNAEDPSAFVQQSMCRKPTLKKLQPEIPPPPLARIGFVPHSWGSGTGSQYLMIILEFRATYYAIHFETESVPWV